MGTKKKVKMAIDVAMTVLLLFVMAYQVTGGLYHEVCGIVMLALFVAHNALNISWYGKLFKGKYGLVRVIWTLVNLATLVAILVTGFSGIAISKHLFASLHLFGGSTPMRILHLAGSHWTFVLISCHLGLHWGMVVSALRKHINNVALWIMRVLGIALAAFGAICFCQQGIYSYMFLQSQFAFLDYEKAGFLIIFENAAMLAAFVCISYYVMRALTLLTAKRKDGDRDFRHGFLCLMVALFVFLLTFINLFGGGAQGGWS